MYVHRHIYTYVHTYLKEYYKKRNLLFKIHNSIKNALFKSLRCNEHGKQADNLTQLELQLIVL